MEKTPIQDLIDFFDGKPGSITATDLTVILKGRLPVEKQWAKEVWEAGRDRGQDAFDSPDFPSYYTLFDNDKK